MTVWLLRTVSRVCYFVMSKNMELLFRRSILLYWRDCNILCNKAVEKRLEFVCRYFFDKIKTEDFLYYGILRLSKKVSGWNVRGSNPLNVRFFSLVQTGSKTHSTSSTMDTGFPWG
jgi:hypothetical protein